jgi:iron complex transport system permease protein
VTLDLRRSFNALLGSAPRNITMVVTEWRLPRVAMAILVGAALGVSGAIFQSLMRNPLGSPDVMGLNTGAWSGVLVAMVLFGQHLTAITFTAMAGGILTSLVIWALAWRNGIDTFRLIIIGIGIRAMLMAFNTWLCCRPRWKPRSPPGCGTPVLNGLTWGKTWPAAPLILLMFIGALLLVRHASAGDGRRQRLRAGRERRALAPDADAGGRTADRRLHRHRRADLVYRPRRAAYRPAS